MILDASTACNTVSFDIGSSGVNRQWDIKGWNMSVIDKIVKNNLDFICHFQSPNTGAQIVILLVSKNHYVGKSKENNTAF